MQLKKWAFTLAIFALSCGAAMASSTPDPSFLEKYWRRIVELPITAEAKAARLVGFVEGSMGLEPPIWWQRRLLFLNNWSQENTSNSTLSERASYNRDSGRLSIKIDLLESDPVELNVDPGIELDSLQYSLVDQEMNKSVVLVYYAGEVFHIARLSLSSEILWKHKIISDDPILVASSGPAADVPRCEVKVQSDKIAFFGARLHNNVIVEVSCRTGDINCSATLNQVRDNNRIYLDVE